MAPSAGETDDACLDLLAICRRPRPEQSYST